MPTAHAARDLPNSAAARSPDPFGLALGRVEPRATPGRRTAFLVQPILAELKHAVLIAGHWDLLRRGVLKRHPCSSRRSWRPPKAASSRVTVWVASSTRKMITAEPSTGTVRRPCLISGNASRCGATRSAASPVDRGGSYSRAHAPQSLCAHRFRRRSASRCR